MTRPLTLVGAMFLITAMVVSFCSFFTALFIGLIFMSLAIISGIAFTSNKRLFTVAILMSGAVAAFSYAYFANNEFSPNEFDNQTGQITAQVLEINQSKNSTAYNILVKQSSIENMKAGFKAILYAGSDKPIQINDIISVKATVLGFSKMPSFDMESFYRADGIAITFTSYNDIEIIQNGKHDLFYYAKQINSYCCDRIDENVAAPYSGFIKAILLGNKSDIDELSYNYIVRAGISHIFVISGLHISMLAMMVFFLLKLCGAPLKVRSIITIFAAWGFVLITGLGLPAVRAGIMMTALMLANLIGRKADALNSLFLAGIVIVLINPAAITGGSFLLSFSATLGVILITNPMNRFAARKLNLHNSQKKSEKAVSYIINILSVTLASNIFMLPVIIYIFKGISVVAPIVNLVAVPFMPVLLVVSLLLLLFNFIPPLCLFLGKLLELMLDAILSVCRFYTSFDFSYIGLNYEFVYIWLWVAIILIGIAWLFIRQKRVLLNTAFISFGTLIICSCLNFAINHNNIQITTINSFNAQAVLILSKGTASVISFGDDNYIDIAVENFLRSKNIHLVENYIFTSSEQKNIMDTTLLTSAIPTDNIFLFDDDELLGYAKDLFNPQNFAYPIEPVGGFDLPPLSSAKLSLDRLDAGVLLSLTASQTKLAITNSVEMAENANCEILYYCGEYDKNLKQNPAKYVIILNEFVLARLNEEVSGFNAYQSQITVTLRPNGSFRID